MAGKVEIVRDNRLKGFRKRLKAMQKGATATVGVQGIKADEVYGEGTPVVVVAAVHEFGSEDGTIPQRSYLRSTYDANIQRYRRIISKGMEKASKGQGTELSTMFQAGETYRADVIKAIKAGIPPDLKDATKARKGSTLPLVDTGILVAAITSVVKKGTKRV